MTSRLENARANLGQWQKAVLGGTSFLFMVSLALVIFLVFWHLDHKSDVDSQARTGALSQAKDNVQRIVEGSDDDLGLTTLGELAKKLADDLSEGRLKDEDVNARLLSELETNPGVGAVAVAYSPRFVPGFAQNDGGLRYAPFSIHGKSGDPEITYIKYDYTAPKGSAGPDGNPIRSDWYLAPLKQNALVWGEPYFGTGTHQYWAGVGQPFYRTDPDSGERVKAGVVDVSLTLDEVQALMAGISLDGHQAAGYGFIVSQTGVFIAHPFAEFVTQGTGLSELAEGLTVDDLKRMYEENKNPGEPVILEHLDTRSGRKEFIFLAPVPSAGWWVGIVLDIEEFRTEDVLKRLRREQIGIALATFALLFFGTILVSRAYRGDSRSLRTVSITFAVLCIAAISYLWFLNLTTSVSNDDENVILVERATTEKVIGGYARGIENPILLPTGVFVQSVEFSSANNVTVTGYIWQRYPASLGDDPDGIKPLPPRAGFSLTPGFIFPEADSTNVGEVYRQVQTNGDEVIGWDFRSVLRQQFNYAKYPFDREEVWLRMWPKDFDKNIILTPDLVSYHTTDPGMKPGLELQDFVLEDWDITETFFSYRDNTYNTSFGIEDVARQNGLPELYFNVALQRRFINAFVSNLIPIIVVALLLFAVLLTVASREQDGAGFSTSGVLSFCAALFFVVIIAHVNQRTSLAAQSIIYLELFYFVMYGAILSVAINAILIASTLSIGPIHYRNNFIARLLYWPVVIGVLLALSLAAFF